MKTRAMTKRPSFNPNNPTLYGIGTDIIEIERIKHTLRNHGKRFLKRIFTEKEVVYCQRYKDPAPHFAARFAAKEAIFKALGQGLHTHVHWKDIEILNDLHGKPEVHLSKTAKQQFGIDTILLSISHCRTYAIATAIALGVKPTNV